MAETLDKTPELPPPFVNIAGIANFRDIGGYSTTDGRSIRRNLVYRSADPSKVQPEGLAKLKELGVVKVFDLRSVPEIQRQGPEWKGVEVDEGRAFVTRDEGDDEEEPLPEGRIERIWCPVFRDTDYGPEQVAIRFRNYATSGSEGFVKAYTDIMENGVEAYKTILLYLAQQDPKPCLVHCTAGKDRTGVISALLYLLCDVREDTVAYEYSLTDRGLEHLKPVFAERLLKNPALEGNEQGVRNMIGSQPEKMAATIEMIKRRYGGAEGYIRKVVGLSDDDVARLKRNLTSDDVPVYAQL